MKSAILRSVSGAPLLNKRKENSMPEPVKPVPTDEEFEALMADPPRGGFSAWQAAQVTGVPYQRVLKAMKAKDIEVWDLGHVSRLTPKTVRQLRKMSRGEPRNVPDQKNSAVEPAE
jgi:hypothetical protein